MKKIIYVLIAVTLAACSSKKAATGSKESAEVSSEVAYAVRMATPKKTVENVTARCKYDAKLDKKQVALSGSLKMQRGSLIQLSVTMLGFEVGRIEFTKTGMLIVDRINKRYIEGSYDQVAFARDNGLSFATAEGLFWGELFEPGQEVPRASSFTALTTGSVTTLTTHSEDLVFAFMTTATTGDLRMANVSDRKQASRTVSMTYEARNSENVPTSMTLVAGGEGHNLTLKMALSNLKTNTGSDIQPTTIDKTSYRAISPETALSSILKFEI